MGLVRDPGRPQATRFEVRAPNPHTNTYLALAAFFQAMADGISYAVNENKTEESLLAEFNKAAGEEADYLPAGHAFRSEEDVFEQYDAEERDRLFGRAPATVWETLRGLLAEGNGRDLLSSEGVFPPAVLDGYIQAMLARWRLELRERLLPDGLAQLRACLPLHRPDEAEAGAAWEEIDQLCREIRAGEYFRRIREALEAEQDEQASVLQQELAPKLDKLQKMYNHYRRWYGR